MGVQLIRGRLLVAILLAAGSGSVAAAPPDPAVKMSGARICHERGTPGYQQTIHFRSFASLEACLKSGGRLPKNLARKAPHFDLSKPPRPGDEGVQFGPLVRVIDGDTLVVKIQGSEATFRLSGVDAPEKDQPFGKEATTELEKIVGSELCVMQVVEQHTYGRAVAHLWIGDVYVNAEMMRRGMAWFDSEYAEDDSLYSIEEVAREQARGLWALLPDARVPPWEWRHEKR